MFKVESHQFEEKTSPIEEENECLTKLRKTAFEQMQELIEHYKKFHFGKLRQIYNINANKATMYE